MATQSQNNDDAPSPQDGICPEGKTNRKRPASAQRTNVCWVMIHNRVIANNNGATPTSGGAPGLVGAGMTIAGGRHDIVADNPSPKTTPGASSLLPYPATEAPPPQVPESEDRCKGGVGSGSGETYVCYYDDFANEIEGNTFSHNGGYGNPTNGDIGEVSNAESDGNCWHGNVEAGGGEPSSYPPAIQTTHGTCGQPNSGEPATSVLSAQATCDSQLVAPCPPVPGEDYPRSSEVKLMALPRSARCRTRASAYPPTRGARARPPTGTPVAERLARRRLRATGPLQLPSGGVRCSAVEVLSVKHAEATADSGADGTESWRIRRGRDGERTIELGGARALLRSSRS